MRKFLIAIVLLLGVIFVIWKFTEVQAIFETLKRGDWRFVILALGVQLLWLVNVGASYRSIYRAMGLEEKLSKLIILATAANFVNVVAPVAGMTGMAVLIDEARRRKYSTGRVTAAGVLTVLFDYGGLLSILTLGLIVLIRRKNLTMAELVATAILVSIAVVLAFLLYLGMRSADELGRALAWMARLVNRLAKPFSRQDYLPEKRAYEFAQDAAEGLSELRHRPWNLLAPTFLAFSSKILLLIVLWLMFLAFKVPYSAGTIVAGFSIGYLFFIVSPTPSGIGVVETVLTITLRSLNVPLSDAAIITLAYRGITFWFPLLLGLLAFRFLSTNQRLEPAI